MPIKIALLNHFATLTPSPTHLEYVLGVRASATSWLANSLKIIDFSGHQSFAITSIGKFADNGLR
ncbi:MAG: hypothetical protein JSS30_08455 [Verrucomicrobia bacterium]|nr:hypothetical protein [Verrucomicrobiota bacterium]